MDWKTLFLTADGRIGRRDFWIGFAVIFAASVVANMVPVLGQIVGLLLIWPQVCIHAKRLHDMGRTAWLMLLPFAVMVVAMSVAVATVGVSLFSAAMLSHAGSDAAAAGTAMAGLGAVWGAAGLCMLVGVAFLLWVGLTPGQPGENVYGPEPVPAIIPPSAPPPGSPPSSPPASPIVEP